MCKVITKSRQTREQANAKTITNRRILRNLLPEAASRRIKGVVVLAAFVVEVHPTAQPHKVGKERPRISVFLSVFHGRDAGNTFARRVEH